MAEDRDTRVLVTPKPRLTPAQAAQAVRVLSLTGGGYRGLFTAKILVDLCGLAGCSGPLEKKFDVFAGTSIGGVLACALAVGVAPGRVLDAIEAHGAKVFPKKRGRTLRRVLFGSLYDSDNLAKVVDEVLGGKARLPLKNLRVGLLVPAVDWASGGTELFQSAAFGKAHASDATLRDVCLATAAAPTYFKPHEINGRAMLDGGLVANNPDAIALLEVARRWPSKLGHVEMLSIGTAGTAPLRAPHQADKSGARWAPTLPEYMMTVQEQTAAAQSQRVLGRRYLRINHIGPSGSQSFERLDLADAPTRQALLDAGTEAASLAYGAHKTFVDRIFSRI